MKPNKIHIIIHHDTSFPFSMDPHQKTKKPNDSTSKALIICRMRASFGVGITVPVVIDIIPLTLARENHVTGHQVTVKSWIFLVRIFVESAMSGRLNDGIKIVYVYIYTDRIYVFITKQEFMYINDIYIHTCMWTSAYKQKWYVTHAQPIFYHAHPCLLHYDRAEIAMGYETWTSTIPTTKKR